MSFQIADLRRVFGVESPQAKAAEFVDRNAPTGSTPVGGRPRRIRTSKNDLFDTVLEETRIARDILFPPDLKEAFNQLVKMSTDTSAAPQHVSTVAIARDEHQVKRSWSTPQEVPIEHFLGTTFEPAVKTMLGHQARQDALLRSTVDAFAQSVVFENQFPGVLKQLRAGPFAPTEKFIPPPATVEKTVLTTPNLTVRARIHNLPHPSGMRALRTHKYELILQTLPNSVIALKPIDLRYAYPYLGTPQARQLRESTKVIKADANGFATVVLGRDLNRVVSVFDPSGQNLHSRVKVTWPPL